MEKRNFWYEVLSWVQIMFNIFVFYILHTNGLLG